MEIILKAEERKKITNLSGILVFIWYNNEIAEFQNRNYK